MREILFRGKVEPSGVWVYGGYATSNFGEPMIFLSPEEGCILIDPATIGQFTGLCDKNGKKIFENMIVRAVFKSNQWKGRFLVTYSESKAAFAFDNGSISVSASDLSDISIVDEE